MGLAPYSKRKGCGTGTYCNYTLGCSPLSWDASVATGFAVSFISSRKILLVKFVYCPDAKITILDRLNDDSLMLKYSSSARWNCNRNIYIPNTHTYTHICIFIYLCILKQQYACKYEEICMYIYICVTPFLFMCIHI